MSGTEAEKLARQFAQAQGIAVEGYRGQPTLEGDTWHVHFSPGAQDAKPSPGDFFAVLIDCRGAAPPRLIYGK